MQGLRDIPVILGRWIWYLLALPGHTYRMSTLDRVTERLDHRRANDIAYSNRVVSQTIDCAKRLEQQLAQALTTLETDAAHQLVFTTFEQAIAHLGQQAKAYLANDATAEELLEQVSTGQAA